MAHDGDGGMLLLLGADQFLRERAVTAAVRCYGGPVVSVAANARLGRNRYFDDVLVADPGSPEEVLASVQAYVRRTGRRPDGVVPLNDWVLWSAHAVAEAFALPALSGATIERCRNKAEMKRAFAAHGLPTPAHCEFSTVAELCDLAPLLGYPLVIKPRDFGGSGGVIKISGEDEIAAAFEHCRSILEQYADAFHIPADAFQAEEYVAATDEISVEVLVTRGCPRVLAVTDKYLGPEPWFAELGHVVPSTHSHDSSITEIAERACEALDIELGVAHVEIRLLADGTPKLMEVGARPGGDGIMELVERVYGTSPYEWHIRACLGEEAPATAAPRPSGTAAIAFLKAPSGRITAIDPSPSLPEPIVNLTVTAVPGDLSEPPICWRSREGVVELFWPGSPRPSRIHDHLELATSLSGSIFTTAQA